MKKIFFAALLLIAAASIILVQSFSSDQDADGKQHSDKSFSVQHIRLSTGVDLEYVEQGNKNGMPVIFLHGLSDSWHSFETTLPYISSSVHAYALSQRGHGNSSQSKTDYTSKAFASDVAAFIRQKNLGPVVIVGHSMGGVNAMRFAVDFPELTKALVIVGSDPAFKNNKGLVDFAEQVSAMPDGPMDAAFMNEFQGSTIVKPIDSNYYRLILAEGMKVPMTIFKAALNGVVEDNLLPRLSGLKKPTLIIWGDKDNVCVASGQDALRKAIPGSRFIEYTGTGHALHWEEPQRFANDLMQFIESLNTSK